MRMPYMVKCSICHVPKRRPNRNRYKCAVCHGRREYPREWESVKRVFSMVNRDNQVCAVCGTDKGLHIHHKDKNKKNSKLSNLEYRCKQCHISLHMVSSGKKIAGIRRGLLGNRIIYQ